MARPESAAEWLPLVVAAQRGDRDAFAALYGHFAASVHAVVLAHAGPAEAVDLTQEVFLRVYAALGSVREPAAFAGFLMTAARHAALDAVRRRRRAPVAAVAAEELPAPGHGPLQAAEARDAAAAVYACIAQLPMAYREPLLLRLLAGLSGAEIASRTGLTEGSVRVNLTRGMALLRPLLQEAGLP